MMKCLALTVLLVSGAQAASNILCVGKYQDKHIQFNGSVKDILSPKTGHGTVAVDGREVAEFDGADAKINYIFLSAKVQNSRGELLEGKVTDLKKGAAMITRLLVPGFGIDYRNIAVTCKEKAL